MLTYGQQGVLQLQGEGGQGDVLGDGQHGDGGQVGRLIASVPLADGGVQGQTASWRSEQRSRNCAEHTGATHTHTRRHELHLSEAR